MTANEIICICEGLGFDAVAALSAEEAMAALAKWKEHAGDGPYFPTMDDFAAETQGWACVLVMAMPYRTYDGYPAGVGRVGGYYPASQRSYVAANKLAALLCESGVRAAMPGRHMRLKPLARAAGIGEYGRNGVIVREGPHLALQAVYADIDAKEFPRLSCAPMPCDACGACERACPSGALGGGLVDARKCLRSYMNGNEAPAELVPLMGDLLLGCDACLNACPRKEREPMPSRFSELFAFDALLDEERFAANRKEIEALIGVNFARPLRNAALRWQERREATERKAEGTTRGSAAKGISSL